MPKDTKKFRTKREQMKMIYELLGEYKSIVQVTLGNVTAAQFKEIHRSVREKKGRLIVLKNSLMRKAVDFRVNGPDFCKAEKYQWAAEFVTEAPQPQLAALRPLLKQQFGYIFSQEPVFELKPRIEALTVPAAARVGMEAQRDVVVPTGPTGMDPSQISFFHALQITTKIVKGQIEIQKEFQCCTKDQKVTPSAVALLKAMNMKPFTYGMKVIQMYDAGSILDSTICSLKPEDLLATFQQGVANITALSLQTGYATEVSVPHDIISSFKSLCALQLETGYKCDFIAEAMKGGGSAPVQEVKKDTKGGDKKEAPKVEEPSEEEDEDMDMGDMFAD